MHFDSSTPSTILLAFNGEPIGHVVEADTTEGYVIQKIVAGHMIDTVRKTGRVDIIGDREKDSNRTLYDNLNKIRKELGLEVYSEPPFLDE